MGNFYANVVVRGASAQAVRDVLAERRFTAFITPALNGSVLVYEERSDGGDVELLSRLGQLLSERLRVTTLTALNHDDDVLALELFHSGRRRARYVNLGGLMYGVPPTLAMLLPVFAAWAICWWFRKLVHLPYVWLVLQRPRLFQVMRHAALAQVLDLPVSAAVLGHGYVERGELPEGVERQDLLRS